VLFETIFSHIIGSSLPAARLRASGGSSIFSHDMRRYRRTLYERMGDFATAHHRTFRNRQGTGRASDRRNRDTRLSTTKSSAFAMRTTSHFPINISALSPSKGAYRDSAIARAPVSLPVPEVL